MSLWVFPALFFVCALPAAAFFNPSAEYPWTTRPEPVWEQELANLKGLGIRHIFLPAGDPVGFCRVARIIQRLHIEIAMEGAARVSAADPDVLVHSRRLLESGTGTLIWTDVTSASQSVVRREVSLASLWKLAPAPPKEQTPGVAARVGQLPPGVTVRQFEAGRGASFVSVINRSELPFRGDLKAWYAGAKRQVVLPDVAVSAHGAALLPVSLRLPDGGFAAQDHLIYSTAELTGVEYENGVLALEFYAPAGGEVTLQLSVAPTGPLIAAGKPGLVEWAEKEHHARLVIPPAGGPDGRVRLGLAIKAPDVTGFFKTARVLLIGETNHIEAQFSSAATAKRSRIRLSDGLRTTQRSVKGQPLELIYDITVPGAAVPGDKEELSIEADGIQLGHSVVTLVRPAAVVVDDPVRLPRRGGQFAVTVTNNASEIRNFRLEIKAPGIEFLPGAIDVSVGASVSREVTFRVIPGDSAEGLHAGAIALSGAVDLTQPLRFEIVPR